VFLLLARTPQVSAAWGVWVKSKAPANKPGLFQRILPNHEEREVPLIIQQVFYI